MSGIVWLRYVSHLATGLFGSAMRACISGPVKYETPSRQRAGLDVPPGVAPISVIPRYRCGSPKGVELAGR
jgi:hypothetical protein